jgi:hypothetical protein
LEERNEEELLLSMAGMVIASAVAVNAWADHDVGPYEMAEVCHQLWGDLPYSDLQARWACRT